MALLGSIRLLSLAVLLSVAVEGLDPPPPRRLFALFVFHEASLQSSGYNNWGELGCGVFTNAKKTAEFVAFAGNATNRVGMVKLDLQPLYKNFDSVVGNYDTLVHELHAAGVEIQFMESNAVPGDSCADNCPTTCAAVVGAADDSCTPSYMDFFHAMADRLFARYPSVPLGLAYDVEQSDPKSGDRSAVWSALGGRITAFTRAKAAERGSALFTGYSLIRPAIWDFSLNQTLLTQARSLDDQTYFSALDTQWDQPGAGGPIDGPNGIQAQVEVCRSATAAAAAAAGEGGEGGEEGEGAKAGGSSCKVVMGFETSDEGVECKTYKRCKGSFVWGGGLPAGTNLVSWIENTLEPTLESKFGIVVARDLDSVPYFVEHHASFMAYMSNAAAGKLPAPQCFRAECTTCCPNQKHRTLCLGG